MGVKLSDHFTYKKIFKAVYAPILMMVFISIYGVVDGIFVANFAQPGAFAGLNLIYPLIMIVGGTGFMFGTGGSALVSKLLGENKKERANQVFSMIIYFTLLFAVFISLLGFMLVEPLANALAKINGESSPDMIKYAILYGKIMMCGQVAFIFQNLFQNFFVVNEKPQLAFKYTLIAGCTNMILDFLFVGLFKWGIVGAAVASITSMIIGGIFPMFYFIKHKEGLIHLVKTKIELKPILKSCGNGASEFVNNISSSILGLVYNIQLLRYLGENGISAYGIIMYLQFVFIAIFIGYTIGICPIISYNFGAKNDKELKNVVKKSIVIIACISLIMLSCSELLAKPLSNVFANGNQELLKITTNGMRIYALAFLFCGLSIFISALFTALNNGLISAIVSFVRTLILQLLFVILLPLLFNETGIWLSVVIAEGLAFIISFAFYFANKKKYAY